MGFFAELFGKSQVDIDELKKHLDEMERLRRKEMFALRKICRKHDRIVEKIKRARQSGNDLEVDYRWQEIKQLRFDARIQRRRLKVINLEAITVKKYVHGLQLLEQKGLAAQSRSLMAAIRSSGLDARLEAKDCDDQLYLDDLNAIFNEAGLEEVLDDQPYQDDEKMEFIGQLDAIIAFEESGDLAEADIKKKDLRKQWEQAD